MTTEVNVLLNKKRYFYNRYSEEIVSDELINYIYHESIGSNFKNKVKINIKCNFEVTEEEKEKMMSMIRNMQIFTNLHMDTGYLDIHILDSLIHEV